MRDPNHSTDQIAAILDQMMSGSPYYAAPGEEYGSVFGYAQVEEVVRPVAVPPKYDVAARIAEILDAKK